MGNEIESMKKQEAVKEQTARDGEMVNIIRDLRKQQKGHKVVLMIDRESIFDGSMPHFKTKGSELNLLDIQFKAGGLTEEVVNLGGPSKEFFTLLLKEFTRSKMDMFEGNGGFLLPVNNQRAIQGDMFYYFGKILVLSIISDGPGFPYFPPYIISFFRQKEFTHELNTMYVVNTNLKEYIKAISTAETQEELDKVIGENEDRFLEFCGWQRTDRISKANRLYYIQTLLKWELYDQRQTALEQLRRGLNVLHFLERTEPLVEFEHLFQHREKHATTADFIKNKLLPKVENLEPKNEKEENAKKFTLECLKILEEKEAAHLFQFMTGLDDVPVYDFDVEVDFNRTDCKAELPKAITCIQRLIIPLGNETKLQFYSSFNKAITLGRVGFDESSF